MNIKIEADQAILDNFVGELKQNKNCQFTYAQIMEYGLFSQQQNKSIAIQYYEKIPSSDKHYADVQYILIIISNLYRCWIPRSSRGMT